MRFLHKESFIFLPRLCDRYNAAVNNERTGQTQFVCTSEKAVNLDTEQPRSDNETFTVDREVAEKSILIKNMIEDIGDSDEA